MAMTRLKFPDDISPSGAQQMFDAWYDVHFKADKMADNVQVQVDASEAARTQTAISDEEIDKAADDFGFADAEKHGDLPNLFADVHFRAGAKWAIEKLKGAKG